METANSSVGITLSVIVPFMIIAFNTVKFKMLWRNHLWTKRNLAKITDLELASRRVIRGLLGFYEVEAFTSSSSSSSVSSEGPEWKWSIKKVLWLDIFGGVLLRAFGWKEECLIVDMTNDTEITWRWSLKRVLWLNVVGKVLRRALGWKKKWVSGDDDDSLKVHELRWSLKSVLWLDCVWKYYRRAVSYKNNRENDSRGRS